MAYVSKASAATAQQDSPFLNPMGYKRKWATGSASSWWSRAARQSRKVLDRCAACLGGSPSNGDQPPDAQQIALNMTTARIEQLEIRLAELEEQFNRHVSGSRTNPSMTLTVRGQVLKMAKKGERPEQIAGALGIPAGEVALLLKIGRRSSHENHNNADRPEPPQRQLKPNPVSAITEPKQ